MAHDMAPRSLRNHFECFADPIVDRFPQSTKAIAFNLIHEGK